MDFFFKKEANILSNLMICLLFNSSLLRSKLIIEFPWSIHSICYLICLGLPGNKWKSGHVHDLAITVQLTVGHMVTPGTNCTNKVSKLIAMSLLVMCPNLAYFCPFKWNDPGEPSTTIVKFSVTKLALICIVPLWGHLQHHV